MTTTNTTTNFFSNHPTEHKVAAFTPTNTREKTKRMDINTTNQSK
jgi:hypothetical protein